MNTEVKVLGTNDVENVIDEIEKAYYDIPFGNTEFQTRVFILDSAITPERRYRNVGLQLLASLNSVREAVYNKKIYDITREENLEKLNSGTLSKWDTDRLALKISKEDADQKFNNKLLNDSLRELNILYKEFKKLPKYTREQFESAEENYFVENLQRQCNGITGAVEALINIREDKPAMEYFLDKLNEIEKLDNQTLQRLRLDMPNQLKNVTNNQIKQNLKIEK